MTTAASTTCARLKAEVRPFRPVALQLLRMVGSPTVAFGKVAGLVQTDAVLSMELLKIANSPLFQMRMEISSVLQAIVFLGSDMVSALVLTTCLKSLVAARSSPFILACWRHCLATALICQRLSDAMKIPESNGYTAGLIHDIGQLALLSVYPSYEKALGSAKKGGSDLLDVERELFGLDHSEAGRWLLSEWGCPLELQNVAAYHENPLQAKARDGNLVRLVHGSSALANLMGMSVTELAQREDLSQIAAALPEARPELTVKGFGELTENVLTKVNGVEVSLGLGPMAPAPSSGPTHSPWRPCESFVSRLPGTA
jgi:HD-like signal output (HDOD) protein